MDKSPNQSETAYSLPQVRSLLTFLNNPVDEQRLDCLAGGRRETFHRLVDQEEVVEI